MRRTCGWPVLLAAVVLAGCSSVPLGTLWKLSRMGPEALFEAEPVEIRAAARSERWFLDRPGFDTGVLEVALESPSVGDRDWSFVLDEVSDREAWRLEPAPDGQRWRVYRIALDDLEAFQGMQRDLPALVEAAKASEGENRFSIAVHFGTDAQRQAEDADSAESEAPTRSTVVPYRVDLQLDEDEGFFTLLRDDDLEVSMLGEEATDDGGL